jgi:hypothetical protein
MKITPRGTTYYVGDIFETTDSMAQGTRITRKHIFAGASRIASVESNTQHPTPITTTLTT